MKIPASLIILFTLPFGGFNTAMASEIRFVGVSGDLLLNVERHVRLVKRLRNNTGEPLLEGELRRLKSRVIPEIRQALEPYGYYNVDISIDDQQRPEDFAYIITLNRPVLVDRLNIVLSENSIKEPLFRDWRDRFPLQQSLPLDQSVYSEQKKALLSSAVGLGYFDAKFTKSDIIIDQSKTSADIFLNFESGKRYALGDITIEWNVEPSSDPKNKQGFDQGLLDSLITTKPGQFYTADVLSDTQRNLLATPYFSSVDVRAGERDQQTAKIPVTISLTPNKRKAYNLAVGIGTDTGIRGSVGYENRRINRKGHHINVRVGGSEIQRTAIANYRIPLKRSLKDNINLFTSFEEEFGDTRRFESSKIGAEWAYEWRKALIKIGVSASRETFVRQEKDLIETEQNTNLLIPSVSWERTKGDDLYFPTQGWRASATLRGASSSLGSDINLVQALFKGKLLRQLGSGRVKLRVQLNGSLIGDAFELPDSLGFLAGGDDSVRGYSFESIGVNRNNQLSVAKNLAIGSIEYEHPIKNGFALAAFIDAGDAFDNKPRFSKGAGMGVRWRLPFGALRLDAASALDLDGDPIRLHFSFGTDL